MGSGVGRREGSVRERTAKERESVCVDVQSESEERNKQIRQGEKSKDHKLANPRVIKECWQAHPTRTRRRRRRRRRRRGEAAFN